MASSLLYNSSSANRMYTSIGFGASLNGINKLTFSMWNYALTTGYVNWMYIGDNSIGKGLFGMTPYSDGTVYADVRNSNSNIWGQYSYSAGFVNITMVYDGTKLTNATRLVIYENGIQKTLTFTGSIPATLGNLTGYALYFGYIQYVPRWASVGSAQGPSHVFTDALTQSQVIELMRKPETPFANRMAYWDMRDTSGKDRSGNGWHLTVQNMAASNIAPAI